MFVCHNCSPDELYNIITAPTGGVCVFPETAIDEIVNNLFLGNATIALDLIELRRMGMTHVLNAALGDSPFHVNSNQAMYRKVDITFLGIEAIDFMNFDLSPYFQKAADFIDHALTSGGRVLVHCVQGVSRSATLVIAYLMLKRGMKLQEAVRLVRSRREIYPNEGFLQQLCDLNEKMDNSIRTVAGNSQSMPSVFNKCSLG